MNMPTITKKITPIGNSFGIVIDKPIMKMLKIKKGDFVEVNITKV